MLTLTTASCPFRPFVLCILHVFRLAGLRWVLPLCEMALDRVCLRVRVREQGGEKSPERGGAGEWNGPQSMNMA